MSEVSPKLYLRFTGLCAFVPNNAGSEMRVVMVDASRPHGPHDKAHVAVLLVPIGRVDTGSGFRRPDDTFKDPDGVTIAIFYLSGSDIRIGGAKPARLKIDHPGSKNGCPNPDGSEDDYFSWIGSMRLINVGSGKIHGDCLKNSEVSAAVGGRVFLSEGTLTSFDFARARDGRVVKWGFKPLVGGNPAAQEQALSEEVQLEVDMSTPYVDFLFTEKIYGKDPQSGATLRIAADGLTVVWIVNMPLEDIVHRKYRTALLSKRELLHVSDQMRERFERDVDPSDRDIDHHFVHYYDLLDGGVSNRVPHPIGRCPTDDVPSVANPKCPPVQLDPIG